MNRNPLAQLASLGEDVLDKASQNPTAARVIQGAAQVRDRVDDLTKRVRGLEQMEQRLAQVEERLDQARGNAGEEACGGEEAGRRQLARHADAQRAGHDLERGGRRPDLLALDLDRQALVRVDLDAGARRTSTFGCVTCRPL